MLSLCISDDVVGDDDDGGGGGGGGGAAGALDEIDDGYDSEMYGDDADREYLDGLNELQREIILDERRSKRKEMQERREALSKAAGRSSAATPATRGSTRSAAGKRGTALPYNAIADLIARRENRKATKQSESLVFDDDGDDDMAVEEDEDDDEDDRRPKGRKRTAARKKRDSVSVMEAAQDDDDEQAAEAEGDNDAEAVEEKARQREEARFSIPGSHTPLRLSDMKMLQLRRERLERIYEEPWFADVVKGMFVRVGVGPDSKGVAKYRVGEVVRCEEMKSKYPFPPGSVSRNTRLGLVLRYGDLERTWSMAAISNQSITDEEFSDWSAKMKKAGQPTPTAEEALERKKRAEYLKETYVYTPEQVARMVAEKKGRGKHLNVTLERRELEMELAKVKASVDALRARLKVRGRREQKEDGHNDDEEDEEERRRQDEAQLEEDERRIEQIDNRLSELKEMELKQQKTAKARPELGDILAVNRRNAENDITLMRDMFIQHEREKREEEEQLRREGKTRTVVLDPFKRKATRPQTQFEAEEEVKAETQKEEESKDDDAANTHAQSLTAAQQRQDELARRRLTSLTQLTQLTQRSQLGSGPLAFPKPPSLSDQLLAQLVLEHRACKERVDVSRHGGGLGLLGAAGRSEGGGRLADTKYTHLPAGERVLTVVEYWRRREQA